MPSRKQGGPLVQVLLPSTSASYARKECASSAAIWNAVDNILDPEYWDMNSFSESRQNDFIAIVGLCVNISSEIGFIINMAELIPFFAESRFLFYVVDVAEAELRIESGNS